MPVLQDDWFEQPLPDNVQIGMRSYVASAYCFLHYRSRRPCGVRIGADCGVYLGSFFELGPEGEVDIGDFTAVVGAILVTNRRIQIGSYCLISHEVILADTFTAIPPAASRSLEQTPEGSAIIIEDNVWIGTRAILLGGAHIGEGTIVGAAAVVDFRVPPYSIVAGNPARVVGQVAREKED